MNIHNEKTETIGIENSDTSKICIFRSTYLPIKSGVLKGTILRLTFFLKYIVENIRLNIKIIC